MVKLENVLTRATKTLNSLMPVSLRRMEDLLHLEVGEGAADIRAMPT